MNLTGLKVGIVTNTSQFVGGVEQVNRMMISMFKEHGIEAEIVSRELLNYRSMLYKIKNKVYGQHRIIAEHFNKHFSDKLDIAICNGEYACGVSHVRAVASFHGCYYGYANALRNYIPERSYKGMMRYARDQKIGALGKFVVADSAELARVLGKQGVKVDKVINNAVDTELFRPDPMTDKLDRCLFVGSYDHYGKGFDILGEIADLGIAVDCISKDRPSHPKLGWLSSIPNEELPAYYAKYKFFLLPSRFEGSGLVAAEAMACGTPVIMSNVGLGPELMREIPSFVVDGPWESMAKAMVNRMAVIEANYQTYSREARDYAARHHSYRDWEQNWLDVVRFIMNT